MSNNLGTYQNPVNGGWYNNPQGQNQQWLNGQWQNAPGGSNALSDYQSSLNSLNNNTNNYFNQQQGFGQASHDLTATNLNTLNTQALGTQDQGAKDAFLGSVLDPLQKQEGSVQYGYGMNLGHTNNVYGLNSTTNRQNRDLALAKLANDENFALQGMGLAQGKENAASIDSMNQRGLLYGQSPTGAYQPNAMGGMSGLAGQQTGLVNQDYGIQRGALTSGYGLNVQGANQDYNQQQNMLDENHNFDQKNLAYGAANDVNAQNASYSLQSGMNNNQLAQYKASIENQKQQQLNNNTQTAYTKSLLKNNAYTGQ